MAVEQHVTFCRICEAHCGLIATVNDGVVEQLRPDKEHPLSQGEACPKGIAFTQVQNDPDRVLHPLRRRADGSGFDRVSWETALSEIGERLRGVRDRHGAETIGWYMGNPAAFSHAQPLWVKGFMDAIGSRHLYGSGSQDINNRFAASALLYGSPLLVPIPDLRRTHFLLVIGANPFVSHGSVLTAPRIRTLMRDIVGRGGRVVVVDPRRSETARAFEHVPVRPDADAWLLLSMLHVLFADGLTRPSPLARGVEALAALAVPFAPEETAELTGVPADVVRALARDLAEAPSASVYGRTGSCLGRFGTLVAFLIDAVNVVTGNVDRPGGAVVGRPPVEFDKVAARAGLATYDTYRVNGVPEVIGTLPAAHMASEIDAGRMRALLVSAGNPVLSVPDGETLGDALRSLDLLVSIDFYVNETSAQADYVLPATTFLERADFPLPFLAYMKTPFVQWSDPVVAPRGEAREEPRIIEALARELGTIPVSHPVARRLGKVFMRWFTPERFVDLLLRTGPGRLSVAKLRKHPHGLVLGKHVATGTLRGRIRHRDKLIHLDAPPIAAEVARLRAGGAGGDDAFPLRLIGLRELRSHNSWMHNAPKLMAGKRVHALRVHPADAAACGASEGDVVRLRSDAGVVEVPVLVTDEVMEGTVALPHGWGHHGGWQVANAAGGVNSNVLAGAGTVDPLSGNAFLNGIPVALEPVAVPA